MPEIEIEIIILMENILHSLIFGYGQPLCHGYNLQPDVHNQNHIISNQM